MNEKPFKTHNQMLKILRSRGMIISDGSKAKRILERENYYCIINGYKTLFIDSSHNDEYYKPGTTFDEVFALFSLDRELKRMLLPELLKVEGFIKSTIAYNFHQKYPDKNSYLAFENYTSDPAKTKDILSVIANLSNCISRQKNNAVTHYIEKYQHCPLWVLVNFLSFGSISKLYRVLDDKIRLSIAKEITKHYKQYYTNTRLISPEMLDECLGAFVMFRNTCAHDERLYNYTARFKDSALGKFLNTNLLANHNLFSIIVLLKIFLKKDEYKRFIKSYDDLINKYSQKFKSINILNITNSCGICKTWISDNT